MDPVSRWLTGQGIDVLAAVMALACTMIAGLLLSAAFGERT